MRLTFTRQGDYAIRAMLALASAEPGSWLSVTRISAAMGIPERILPRVMRTLAVADLVEARTGRTGGYRLTRPAASITLLDIITAAEPANEARACVLRGGPCGLDGRCAVHDVIDEARGALDARLASTSLADLTHRAG
jgi:Rrf2 family protein